MSDTKNINQINHLTNQRKQNNKLADANIQNKQTQKKGRGV